MPADIRSKLPAAAVGLRPCLHVGDDLRLCEIVIFESGFAGVETTLRRAAIAGRVEVDGEIADHFADVMDTDHCIIETVALDAKSYRALKTRWMRCKVEQHNAR